MRNMLSRNVVSAVVAIVVITVAFGFAYPLVMTGISQLAFSSQANGSLIKENGNVVGSKLAAQQFTSLRYFHERPSGTSPAYNAGATTFANLGPTNQSCPLCPWARSLKKMTVVMMLPISTMNITGFLS